MNKTLPPKGGSDPQGGQDKKTKIKQQQHQTLSNLHTFIIFRGAPFHLDPTTNRFTPLTTPLFATLAYQSFPYATIQQIKEVEHLVRHSATDLSHLDYLIGLPNSMAWNTRTLQIEKPQTITVLRSPVAPNPNAAPLARAYLLELSNGDSQLADDYLQAIAPLFMDRKPTGVIWFIGGGANGKSALISAIYRLLPDHLTSLTVAAIEDGRDTPRLNGVIGNVCRESSESRVEDTERYKALGTHEPFSVHKFHSQDSITIQTNVHTIFNANNIPVFSDKTEGARRRTLIVPFPAKFKDDPMFETKTFTPEFLGGLLHLILEATKILRDNHYQYKFSSATLTAKGQYDAEVNSAEAFLAHLRDNKVKAFSNYRLLRQAYENWCMDQGLVPLGVTSLKRVMTNIAFATNKTFRAPDGGVQRWYFIDKHDPKLELVTPQEGLGLHVELDGPDTLGIPTQQTVLGDDW
jgi:phage/plasmid-associated DNA primase